MENEAKKASPEVSWIKAILPAVLLLALIYMAFSIRMYPAHQTYYPDIDTYYIFRMSNYVLTHEFHMPQTDPLRYYPTSVGLLGEYLGVYYFPSAAYALLKVAGLVSGSYADFSWWFPALLGALSIVPMYFIGKILHGRLTGFFAAFFFAVTPAILSRNSAWYVEKEVQAALFMLMSLYFFIRAIKNSSALSGILSGLALMVFASMWGGVEQLYIGFGLFVLFLLLVNNVPRPLYKIYPLVVVLGMLLVALKIFPGPINVGDVTVMINIAAMAVLLIRYCAERFAIVRSGSLRFVAPGIYATGFLLLVAGGFFSSTIANIFSTARNFLFYQHGVISSTVAENVPPGWGDFANQLGAVYAQNVIPPIASLVRGHLFDVWALGFLGIFVLLYRIYEKRDNEFWLANVSCLAMMYSFWAFLKAGDAAAKGSLQVIFVLSFIAAISLASRKNALASLILTLLFVPMLGSMSKIRVIFLVGPFIAVLAAYALSNIISAVSRAKIFQPEGGSKINVFSAAGILAIGLLLFVNFSAGSAMAHGMGALYNQNWDGAMKYMKAQTPNDSVILSWWDYGYWFQLMGERATNLDGGNGIANRNIPTAQFFTGMMNETEQKFFLQKMGTTHVLVDASMIGKYAAMSKIANYGNRIDAYLQFGATGSEQNGNTTVLAYSASPYFLLVPVNPDGRLAGNIVISVPDGEAYISSICNEKGIFPLNPPKNKRIIDGCVFLGQGYALFASGEVANSVFTRLFFMDGLGIPYLDKVFDNGEVKIYKLNGNVTHETREELLPWWNKYYDGDGLRVFNGTARIYQKVE